MAKSANIKDMTIDELKLRLNHLIKNKANIANAVNLIAEYQSEIANRKLEEARGVQAEQIYGNLTAADEATSKKFGVENEGNKEVRDEAGRAIMLRGKEDKERAKQMKTAAKKLEETIDPFAADKELIRDMFGSSNQALFLDSGSPSYWHKFPVKALQSYARDNGMTYKELVYKIGDMEQNYLKQKAREEYENTSLRDDPTGWLGKQFIHYVFPDVEDKALRTGEGPSSYGQLLTTPQAYADFGLAVAENYNPLRFVKWAGKVPGIARLAGDVVTPATSELTRQIAVSDVPNNIDLYNAATIGAAGLLGGDVLRSVGSKVVNSIPGMERVVRKTMPDKDALLSRQLDEEFLFSHAKQGGQDNVLRKSPDEIAAGAKQYVINPNQKFDPFAHTVEIKPLETPDGTGNYKQLKDMATKYSSVKTRGEMAELMDKYPIYETFAGRNDATVYSFIPDYKEQAKSIASDEWRKTLEEQLNKVPALKEMYENKLLKDRGKLVNTMLGAIETVPSKSLPIGFTRNRVSLKDDSIDIKKKAQAAMNRKLAGEKLTNAELEYIAKYIKQSGDYGLTFGK